ncbi:MAG TPA: hypothetical protein DCE41_22150 [Cytophagales bacterium]|nr:hypothetical protein [Cytophagales bacterium]
MAEVSDDELVAFLEQELDATDVLHYDLAYLEESEDELEGSLWEGSIEDQAVEEYLDDISLDDLEEYGLDEIDL